MEHPVDFDSAAISFTEEEQALLDPDQRAFHLEVMKEIYETVAFLEINNIRGGLGPLIASGHLKQKMKAKPSPALRSLQKALRGILPVPSPWRWYLGIHSSSH
uniref:KRAB domain-containing protein n=1 Tax=Salvator merianae TaxID=96440 RepID=A0A8D0B8Q8_SALMN